MAAQAAADATPLAGSRSVRCRVETTDGAIVSGDGAGLSRVISNLLSNALRYTARDSEVEVRVTRNGGSVILEVADRGPGVAPENRRRIFERFVRLDAARSTYPEGSGLGLAIVDQVVRAHAGEVSVEEREGGGAVFRIRLPAAAASAAAGSATGTSASG